jgi:ferredoxin--NADP+ reductase
LYRIIERQDLAPNVKLFRIETPFIARKAQPGQFVIVRIHEEGERIPLTVADFDREGGTITLIFQEVGKTTKMLGTFREGDEILDVVGPLGRPTEIEKYGTVVCVGGGVGIASVYPITRALKEAGNRVISIIGARSKNLLILEDEIREVSDELYITTDDGSYGRRGFVSDELKRLIEEGWKIDWSIAIGPAVMMRAVAETTRPYNIKTMVSLNSLMVDGTGMCGCCRVEVGGRTRFVCVDGPDFDGHQVNFKLLLSRQRIYLDEEKIALEKYEAVKEGVS